MKANEFVKKYGIVEASEIVVGIPDKFKFKCLSNTCWDTNTYKYSDRFKPRNSLVNIADLKRLVESHELVGNFGGIKRAKRILKKSYTSFNTMVSVVWNDKPFQCTIEKLEKSILDVESCQ